MFTRTFFELRTGRPFELSHPDGRESHYITIARALVKVFKGETKRLIINVAPRHGKSEMLIHFVAWCLAHFPDSNFIYVSYALSLAKKQTAIIKDIITMGQFKELFHVDLKHDTKSKHHFETTVGGSIYAVGADGTITGWGAGIQGSNRFGGAIVIDDIIKPDEATSDTVRNGTNDWYYNTLESRINDRNTPIIYIGQRTHEEDLAAILLKTDEWESVIIPSLDEVGNAIFPIRHSVNDLIKMRDTQPYIFAAQYQQDPQPAGGGLFKIDWFVMKDEEPQFLMTAITSDTAETDKTYNDATVFSFWGIYKIEHRGQDTGLLGVHLINCREQWIEASNLEDEFIDFYSQCMIHPVKPKVAIIEKKSTGVTLGSSLKKLQGLQIINIDRTKASGSKATRYIEMQPYIASGHFSLPTYGKHTTMVVEHMRKVTANDTHARDDIADTFYDICRAALIDKSILTHINKSYTNEIAKKITRQGRRIAAVKRNLYGNGNF